MDDSRRRFDHASRGDPAAIDDLLADHLPGLRAFIRLRSGPRLRALEESQDLVQSVCREILEHLDRYQYHGEEKFRAWLFATAIRKLANRQEYYAALKRDVGRNRGAAPAGDGSADGELHELYHAFITPSRDAAGREELASVEAAFDELPDDYREVILLARVVGLSHAEIAEQMGRTERSIANLLYRAMAKLSDKLVKRRDD